MSSELEHIPESVFRQRLGSISVDQPARDGSTVPRADLAISEIIGNTAISKLWQHYSELSKWNRRVSLVGPGTADDIVERHYIESLQALELIDDGDETLVDIGTGGGFPGMVLAIALPNLKVTMVEPREKKWAFLAKMSKQLGLSSIALNARVGRPLPASLELPKAIDIVTSRALVITPEIFRSLSEYAPRARFLFWRGKEEFVPPTGYRTGRIVSLSSGQHRRIVEIVPSIDC